VTRNRCGTALLLHTLNNATGRRRTILDVRNYISGNNPLYDSPLTLSPNDRDAGVEFASSATDESVAIVNLWHAKVAANGANPLGCGLIMVTCLDPSYSDTGALRLIREVAHPNGYSFDAAEIDQGHRTDLYHFRANTLAPTFVAFAPSGNAFLWSDTPTGPKQVARTYLWSEDHVRLLRAAPSLETVVWS